MTIWIESSSGFNSGADVYGREIVGSFDSEEIAKSCSNFLKNQDVVEKRGAQVATTRNASELIEKIAEDDLLFSLFISFYKDPGGKGLKGFYRSTQRLNSEKCKALSITVTKTLKDYSELYYHGVYNELQAHHPQLKPIVQTKCLASAIEVGLHDSEQNFCESQMFHRNIGEGIGRGIVRHLGGLH